MISRFESDLFSLLWTGSRHAVRVSLLRELLGPLICYLHFRLDQV